MNLFEESIAATLREHAVDHVDVGGLLDATRRRGRTYRRRRRAVLAGGGTVLVVVAGLGTAVAAPRLAGHGPAFVAGPPGTSPSAPPASSASIGPSSFPSAGGAPATLTLPIVPGAVAAAEDPTTVGTDPSLLHFDLPVAAMPRPVTVLEWTSMAGLERLNLQAGPTAVVDGKAHVQAIQVLVTRDKSQLDPLSGGTRTVSVAGRPATLSSAGTGVDRSVTLRWQPVGGLWAEVETGGQDDDPAIQLAAALTFDSVRRCVVPFQLGWVPPGATVETCDVSLVDGRPSGRATVQAGKSAVTVEVDPGGRLPSAATTTIGGRAATVREYPGDGGKTIMQVDIDYGDHVVDLLAEGAYDRQTVLRIADGYRDLAGEPVQDWPVPLG
jgi:hypothetical protein